MNNGHYVRDIANKQEDQTMLDTIKKVRTGGKGSKLIAYYIRHGYVITGYHHGSVTLEKQQSSELKPTIKIKPIA